MILGYRMNGSITEIYLGTTTKGYVATTVIDTEDLDRVLSEAPWFVSKVKNSTLLYVKTRGGRVSLHRFLLNVDDDREVDHCDGDSLNNRKENLRICTHQQNMMNRKRHKNNKSGVKGVYFDQSKKRWRYEVKHEGKRYRQWANSFEDACASVRVLREQLHQEFAQH